MKRDQKLTLHAAVVDTVIVAVVTEVVAVLRSAGNIFDYNLPAELCLNSFAG